MPYGIPAYPIIYFLQNLSTCGILYENYNLLYTSQHKFSAINTQFIFCPVIGPGNDQHNSNVLNTKQDILLNLENSAIDQEPMGGAGRGSPKDIDPDVNYLPTDFRSLNTQYHKCTELSKHNETEPDEAINVDMTKVHLIKFNIILNFLFVFFL